MGILLDGEWQVESLTKRNQDGQYVRVDSVFRDDIKADADARFPAEKGRYHLYVSYACPWANRTLIMRNLKQLQDIVSYSTVDPLMLDMGWAFGQQGLETADPFYGKQYVHELYQQADPRCNGKASVPVLWDKQHKTIVNNESSEILRMFNTAFNGITGNDADYYPLALRAEIDALNDLIYTTVNNGVYRAGFASTQEAYESAVQPLFETLDQLEQQLQGQDYLVGNTLTEADIRLFVTLIRFDPVYVGHFKCNWRRIVDYPNLLRYTQQLYQHPAFKPTIRFDHIKTHYYASHRHINPTGIVPVGPNLSQLYPN